MRRAAPPSPGAYGRTTPMSPSVAARTELGPKATAERAPLPLGDAASDNTHASRTDTWRLVLVVTVPFWAYLALMRVVTYQFINAGNPGIIVAAPHLRLIQHALLLPLLLLFYRWAITIGWSYHARIRATLIHTGMALLFALLARPVLLTLVAAERGEWNLMGELLHSVFGVRLSVDLWVSSFSDFL